MAGEPEDPLYPEADTIRGMIGAELEGRTIVGVTQHDKEEWRAGLQARIELHLDNGAMVVLHGDAWELTLDRPDGTYRTLTVDDGDDGEGEDVEPG